MLDSMREKNNVKGEGASELMEGFALLNSVAWKGLSEEVSIE